MEPERCAALLRELRPDIVGLQEVVNRYDEAGVNRWLERLTAAGPLTAVSGPTIVHEQGDYGNLLLTRLPVRGVRHVDLSFRRREPRAALDVDLAASGGMLRVIVTHLGLRPAERRFQVRRLIQAIEEQQPGPLILLGDLNEWFVHGRPLRWLRRRFGHRHGPLTFPARWPLFALDRIFVSPPGRLQSIAALHSPLVRQASDHLPLLARIAAV